MKEQAAAIVGRSHLKSVVLVLLLFGLLGVVPFLARSHGQSDGGTVLTRPAGSIGVVTSSKNPLQIALLHWYNANLATQFAAAAGPFGVAFDGANIWVTNFAGNTVSKL